MGMRQTFEIGGSVTDRLHLLSCMRALLKTLLNFLFKRATFPSSLSAAAIPTSLSRGA